MISDFYNDKNKCAMKIYRISTLWKITALNLTFWPKNRNPLEFASKYKIYMKNWQKNTCHNCFAKLPPDYRHTT